ncbi:MAG: hypothetical protein ACFCVC_17405 [Acidimicrobiia bacterium]
MITDLLNDLDERVNESLTTPVEIIKQDNFPSLDEMFVEVPKWHRIEDAVCVVADLRGSTKLNFGKYPQSSARFYEALTGNMVRVVAPFNPAFIDIQGDGIFAIFHGERRYERSLAAGITLKTFSQRNLVPAITKHYSDFPDTGIKVGIHASSVVVKKVGVRGTNEPVWAGKLVNWATKAAQSIDAHELAVDGDGLQPFLQQSARHALVRLWQ